MRVRRNDVIEWIEKIKNRGIEEFFFKDLPEDLKDKRMISKAHSDDMIKSVEKTDMRNKWRIISLEK